MQSLLSFLSALKENNNREWFEANRQWYLEVKALYEQLLQNIISGIARFDPSIGQPSVADCLFRIYRDVRFSKDKLPYKTQMGAFIAPGGRKSIKAGYYVHIEPGNSLMGGGIYMPEPENLKKIRNEIYFNSQAFSSILTDPAFRKVYPGGLIGPKVSRIKDFDPTKVDIELLKYKSFFVERDFTDKEVLSPGFEKVVIDSCRTVLPMNQFLNRAFEGA